MGALLEQKINNIDLRRILITYCHYRNKCSELYYLKTIGCFNCIDCFIEKFENGEITFEEVE